MSGESEYDDGRAVLDHDGVTLRRYYFPIGQSKGRLWGSAHLRGWLPLDISRPRKRKLVVLDLGGFVHPSFSADDPDRVIALVKQHVG